MPRGKLWMIVKDVFRKKCSISVPHSAPKKPVPTLSVEAFCLLRSCDLWISSSSCLRRLSKKRSSMEAFAPMQMY